jgi:hypothetical protein
VNEASSRGIVSRGARGEAEAVGIFVQSVDNYLVRLETSRAQCAVSAHGRINELPVSQSMVRFAALSATSRTPREMMHERPGLAVTYRIGNASRSGGTFWPALDETCGKRHPGGLDLVVSPTAGQSRGADERNPVIRRGSGRARVAYDQAVSRCRHPR